MAGPGIVTEIAEIEKVCERGPFELHKDTKAGSISKKQETEDP